MFKFLTKEYWQKKFHNKKGLCLVFPVIPECDLVDKKIYTCYSSNLEIDSRGNFYRPKHSLVEWNAEKKVFVEENTRFKGPTEYKLYSYGEIYPVTDTFYNYDSYFLNYDPSKINEFDLKELSDICFNLSDENTQSDEIWEKLINYFDERGIE